MQNTLLAKTSRLVVASCATVALTGCMVVPKTTRSYNPECQVIERHVTLEPQQMGTIGSCRGAECTAILAFYGVVAAASVVVSGSVAVVGNVVHWLEERSQCIGRDVEARSPAAYKNPSST